MFSSNVVLSQLESASLAFSMSDVRVSLLDSGYLFYGVMCLGYRFRASGLGFRASVLGFAC